MLQRDRKVPNLEPHMLRTEDFVDISNQKRVNFSRISSSVHRSYEKSRLRYAGLDAIKYIPFPAGTRGFLYYYIPDDLPEPLSSIAGELRFRLTMDNRPESFGEGVDLCTPDGLPWAIPLRTIIHSPNLKGFLLKLTTRTRAGEPPVSEDTVERCRKLFTEETSRQLYKNTIYSLGQPFAVKLDASSVRLWVVSRKGDQILPLAIVTNFLSKYKKPRSAVTKGGCSVTWYSPKNPYVFIYHAAGVGWAHVCIEYDEVSATFVVRLLKILEQPGGVPLSVTPEPPCPVRVTYARGVKPANLKRLYHLLETPPPYISL